MWRTKILLDTILETNYGFVKNFGLPEMLIQFSGWLRRKLWFSFAPFSTAEKSPSPNNYSLLPFLKEFLGLVVKVDAAVTCLAAYALGTLQTSRESRVISNPLARLASLFVVVAILATTAGAWPHKNGQKARVRFLAASTLIRGTFGQNEDSEVQLC
jgi:hypothetical protein